MRIPRIRLTIRLVMVGIAIIALALGLGVVLLRPETISIPVTFTNKSSTPLTGLQIEYRSMQPSKTSWTTTEGGVLVTTEALAPGATKVWEVECSGLSVVTFHCTTPDGITKSVRIDVSPRDYQPSFILDDTGVKAVVRDSASQKAAPK